MSILLIIVIFAAGFLTLYAAYKYGENPIGKLVVYIIVIVIFLVVLCDLAGVFPTGWLNKNV